MKRLRITEADLRPLKESKEGKDYDAHKKLDCLIKLATDCSNMILCFYGDQDEFRTEKLILDQLPKSIVDTGVELSVCIAISVSSSRGESSDEKVIQEEIDNFKCSLLYTRKRLIGIAANNLEDESTFLSVEDRTIPAKAFRKLFDLTEEEFVQASIEAFNKHLISIYRNTGGATETMHTASIKTLAERCGIDEQTFLSRMSEEAKTALERMRHKLFYEHMKDGKFEHALRQIQSGTVDDTKLSQENPERFKSAIVVGIRSRIFSSNPNKLSEDELAFIKKYGVEDEVDRARKIVETGTINPYLYLELANKGYQLESIKKIIEYFNSIDDEEYEYMDNQRYARKDNPPEVDEYNKREENGCCGSCDKEIETPDGVVLIGFNYGH